MKFLIINADDCGFSDAVNEAVERCYRAGRITGVSIMAVGACFQQAAGMLKNIEKTDVGVHMTLTGRLSPCTEDRARIDTLLNKDGTFPADYKSLGLRCLLRKLRQGQVYLELREQIEKVLNEGLSVTHLDSHEHVHMFPEVFDATLKLASEFNIPYIRIPLENPAAITKSFAIKDLVRYGGLRVFASRGRKLIAGTSLKYNDVFCGHFHSHRIDDSILSAMIGNISEGVSELAVHPSVLSEDLVKRFPQYRNAHIELDAIMNGRWKERLGAEGITLVSHKETAR